ncbi:response regulator transcription factor [Pedobacter sp. SYP-B3415]|uniref:LuxR C-terminal-related transcriptional regulator n=1 Tax=Pedobacter sp. SYP-B3415 TaxID=2496641 RepID=UPI00101D938A|nr:response regulator transcription factor [Pedobacter sp. SYP-B3415]
MMKIGILDKDPFALAKIEQTLRGQTKGNMAYAISRFNFDALTNRASFPDVLLIDIEGFDPRIIHKIRLRAPGITILIVSDQSDLQVAYSCFRYGALGYLTKKTCLSNLSEAISVTFAGGSFLSPGISRNLISQMQLARQQEDLLTARELQIAKGIVDGLSYKLVADRYNIALDTVRVYIKRVYRKLNIHSKGELITMLLHQQEVKRTG